MTRFERWLGCLVLGHSFFIVQRFHPGARKVGCARCGKAWVMHDPTKSFLPWTEEFEKFYDNF